MPATLHVGPYDFIPIGTTTQAPWYVIPFDKRGRCTGPLTREHLVQSVRDNDFTDIYLFSHGWNNDWRDAVGDDPSGVATGAGYRAMIASYTRLRRDHSLAFGRDYRPILIGVFWPSTWFVLPWEQAPAIAADDPQVSDAAIAEERRALEALADVLDDADVETFYSYMQEDRLSDEQARDLARMLLPVYAQPAATGPGDTPAHDAASPDQLVEAWRAVGRRTDVQDTGETGGLLGGGGATPEIAGSLGFDPRIIARGASAWLMKDRAGKVGAQGVGPLLVDLLNASPTARVHAIGHSYGCRVLLTAICHPPSLPRPVTSALLLQPAISHLCFATDVAGTGRAGGYRGALERVEQPIMLTFTNEDAALHDFFHLGLIRPDDLGEAQIAGDDEPPNAFAALGGYGPRGCAPDECDIIPIKSFGEPYALGAENPRIIALNSAGVIHGHGDYNKEQVWWALFNQVKA